MFLGLYEGGYNGWDTRWHGRMDKYIHNISRHTSREDTTQEIMRRQGDNNKIKLKDVRHGRNQFGTGSNAGVRT
jgi:hypothetical protein